MSACPACGANIKHAVTGAGDKVPLEVFTEVTGPHRYRVTDTFTTPSADAPTLMVERVADDYPGSAHPDHRKDCPDYGNGRVG